MFNDSKWKMKKIEYIETRKEELYRNVFGSVLQSNWNFKSFTKKLEKFDIDSVIQDPSIRLCYFFLSLSFVLFA